MEEAVSWEPEAVSGVDIVASPCFFFQIFCQVEIKSVESGVSLTIFRLTRSNTGLCTVKRGAAKTECLRKCWAPRVGLGGCPGTIQSSFVMPCQERISGGPGEWYQLVAYQDTARPVFVSVVGLFQT